MALVQQHINDIDLTDVAMLLELLTDLGADGGHWDIEAVHCLDFGGLHRFIISELVSNSLNYLNRSLY